MAHIKSGHFYNGATGAHIDGAEANKHRCSIHHWSDHGIGGRGVLLDYWTYAQENGIKYGEPDSKYLKRMTMLTYRPVRIPCHPPLVARRVRKSPGYRYSPRRTGRGYPSRRYPSHPLRFRVNLQLAGPLRARSSGIAPTYSRSWGWDAVGRGKPRG